ncbi:hypothetical protein RI049_19300 [Cedecea neteri]|uniref:hypothetical protein n=1 Tax=Cedecea neteri TaxID=158822 RepID=UPI002AA8A7CC|nr:hypothetical protein [Cedecea neteri]WPU22168.1 hypothetical protein RI049_19300 [Cedecea neteri]
MALILLSFVFMAQLSTRHGREEENKAAFYRPEEQYAYPVRHPLPETLTVS